VASLEDIRPHLRNDEALDLTADLVIRGWPLTVEGLLRNADATRRRYSWNGEPFVAVSAEVTIAGWSVDEILAGSPLRTRRSYASTSVDNLIEADFELLPTFAAPHYSIRLLSYTESQAERLISTLGEVQENPFFTRRSS